ncbi:MAG: response regulator [bacterium]|nr:response regulator [bacterium]
MIPRLLVVDDDLDILKLLETHLTQKGYVVRTEENGEGMRRAMREEEFNAVVLDLCLPDGDGVSFMNELHEIEPDLPVIIATAHGGIHQAVDAMKQGAYDFSPKPIDLPRIAASVKNAVESSQLRRRLSLLESTRHTRLCGMIGGSPAMQVVYRIIETVARTKAPVMITGESGTGKELAALALHELSSRGENALVDVNCAAIPKDLLESELFGHEKNAFTGAGERSIGRCERADGSTLFLDEITEMDYNLQAKLLRFLQDYSFYRVGGKDRIEVDVRIVSATNRDPMAAIEAGRLREDLYYRLNVVHLPLPPLRQREDDVPELAQFFLSQFAKENGKRFESLAPETIGLLCAYDWPGNVRELRNCMNQSVVLHDGQMLEPGMLPPDLRQKAEKAARRIHLKEPPIDENAILPFEKVECDAIHNALRVTKGNVAKASTALHLSQATIYRKIRDYDIDLNKLKE